jgi:CheY-like chemotaxis protein
MIYALNKKTSPVRILLVEDNAEQRQLLEVVLAAAGFEVDSVSSGLDGVRQMRPGRYDVVLVDYQLPEIDGLMVAKLAEHFMGATRPVMLALTATPDTLSIEARKANTAFDAIIGKSSDLSPLLALIANCLASVPQDAARHEAEWRLLRKECEDYEAEPTRPGALGDDPGPPRILIVEDDDFQRELLKTVLEQRGYVVETLSSGLEVVRRIRENCYDLVLVDYNLPGMDGLAIGTLVLDLMQEHLRPRMIALTATPTRLKAKEVAAGSVFDEIVEKSSDLGRLLQTVDRHLRSSPNPATRNAVALLSLPRPPQTGAVFA